MNKEKQSFTSRLRNSGLLVRAAVSEMIGRDSNGFGNGSGPLAQIKATFGGYKNVSTYDISRTSYAMARAIFFANLYKDRKTGKEYGNDYLLGAPFGKPIVNIAAGFAVGSPVQITQSHEVTEEDDTVEDDVEVQEELDDDGNPIPPELDENGLPIATDLEDEEDPALKPMVTHPTISNTNRMLQDRRDSIFKAVRNSYRDGDFFIAVEDDGEFTLLPPEDVDIITNPTNPDSIEGYDVWSSFPDPDKPNTNETITFVDEIRRTYRRRMQIDKQEQRTEVPGTRVDYRTSDDGGLEERQLPIVHFANEQEARSLYGISEFQNLYYLMANYHAILSAAIKGNIYNSTAVPVIQGVKNMSQFLKQNFQQDKDGNYTLKWDNQKMLVVGDGGSVQILQADGTATDAQTLLEIIFYLICQASETPEFAFGTAVQSSKASVSEQTPMLIKKAIRKQGELEAPLRKLIELYIDRMATINSEEFDKEIEFNIDMPDILDEDLNINIQIVNALLEKGIITEETAMTMLNLGKYVKNFEEELQKARAQKTARSPIPTDVFGQPVADKQTEAGNRTKATDALNAAKLEQIKEMRQHNDTKSVAEMLAKNLDALSLEQIQEMNPHYDGGSEGKDPKATVQEIRVKSGNPYRQQGGRFGSGKGVAKDGEEEPQDNSANGTAMISDPPTEDEIMKLDREVDLMKGSVRENRDTLATGDTTMGRIQKAQGFDGKPQIANDKDFKAAAKASGFTLYRGFGTNEHAQQYVDGKLHSGHGLFGSGTYTSIQNKIAKSYGKSMLQMTIAKDAKVITYNDLNKKILSTWKSFGTRFDSSAGIDSDAYRTVNSLLNNPGRFAASLGYDVINVEGLNNDNQVIILNRTKAIVRETT